MSSKLEAALEAALVAAPDLRGWEREFRAVPARRFRWDFAFPASRLLIEVQGGIYGGKGAHTGANLPRDYEKLNLATIHGYRSLMFGPRDLSKRAMPDTLDTIRMALLAPR